MIFFTKQGDRLNFRYFPAYQGGVYTLRFNSSTTTYTDPFDSSVWTWEDITNDVDEVLGVNQDGVDLFPAESISDCIALEGSWFWDDTNGTLYIHWKDSIRYTRNNTGNISVIVSGYASDYSKTTQNVYDGVYYESIITGLNGLTRRVDPTKFGLVSFDRSGVTIADEEHRFRNQEDTSAVGVPIWGYYTDREETELLSEDRVFTGSLDGYKHTGRSLEQTIIETRLFENKPVCPNRATVAEFSDIGDNKDKFKPTAWGKIRRGKMLLTNQNSLTTSSSGTAIFLVADPALDEVRAINTVYDKEDNDAGSLTVDLTACTVEVTKPAGVSVSDLKDWTWSGEGYDIDGTYNNGLDIIKDAFLKLANVPFLESTYEVGQWNLETSKNPESIGISIQSDKGFIEQLIEPIQTSLQGVVEILGNGKISFVSRDTDADIIGTVRQNRQINDPGVDNKTDSMVSELDIEYSRNFATKDALSFLYDDEKSEIINQYGINRRDPLSPVKSVLTEESDSENLALEIMDTSTRPERIIKTDPVEINKDARIFKMIAIDTGQYDNELLEYGEILSIVPDYLNNIEEYNVRIIPDYEPFSTVQGGYCANGDESITYGCSNGENKTYYCGVTTRVR